MVCLPRMRGGCPTLPSAAVGSATSSPHARGLSGDGAGEGYLVEVFPACAGVVPAPRRAGDPHPGLPRLRGGCPRHDVTRRAVDRSSPHARGLSRRYGIRRRCRIVLAVCAGGCTGLAQLIDRLTPSSSHPRGSSRLPHVAGTVQGVLPACAGVVPRLARPLPIGGNPPRMGGDCCHNLPGSPGIADHSRAGISRYLVDVNREPHPTQPQILCVGNSTLVAN